MRHSNHDAIRNAFAVAIVAHFLMFVFSPVFDVTPYALPVVDDPMVVEEVPDFHYATVVVTKAPNDLDPSPFSSPDPTDEPRPPTPVPPPTDITGEFRPGPAKAVASRLVFFEELPEMLREVVPEYPNLAREAGIEGTVMIRALVNAEGAVERVEILWSDATEGMEQSALEAALTCRFVPGKQRGRPVRAWMSIPFEFRLGR